MRRIPPEQLLKKPVHRSYVPIHKLPKGQREACVMAAPPDVVNARGLPGTRERYFLSSVCLLPFCPLRFFPLVAHLVGDGLLVLESGKERSSCSDYAD